MFRRYFRLRIIYAYSFLTALPYLAILRTFLLHLSPSEGESRRDSDMLAWRMREVPVGVLVVLNLAPPISERVACGGRGRGGLMKLVLVSLNFGFYKIFRFRRDGEIKKN